MQSLIESSDKVVCFESVSRRFKDRVALDQVSLSIPRGCVFGLIGGNGAGKTTLIKHLLGMLKAQQGRVSVFGLNPVDHPVETLGRIGYLSEDRDLPEWMTVGELMRYSEPFFPRWDRAYADELLSTFELSKSSKIASLSRGQRARAGLLIALAHRPELLVLDEPSSGLDPIVRRDVLGAIIKTISDDGRTVLFSSHLLDEVERVADTIGIIDNGKLLLTSAMDEIKRQHSRMTLRFERPQERLPLIAGLLASQGRGSEWTCVFAGDRESLRREVESRGATVVEEGGLSLDEIFVSTIRRLHQN